MNKLTRRQFLQISGVAAGTLLAGYGCTSKPISPTPTPSIASTKLIVPKATGASTPTLEDTTLAIGEYFGQTPPGDTAVVFAPGIISSPNRGDGNIAFSPDGKECYFGASERIYYTKRENATWTETVEAPFSRGHNAGLPFFSADGNRLYFNYWNTDGSDCHVWMVERTTEGWGEPQILPSPINSTSSDYSYTETANGVVYLASNRPGGLDEWGDIWRIRSLADQSLQAENLGPIVNATSYETDPCIAPDESFLIFSSARPGGYSNQDLYVSFNDENNGWTAPINLEKSGAKINIAQYSQVGPSLSPDGKFLFFTRHNAAADKIDVYWVSTHIFVELKKIAFAS